MSIDIRCLSIVPFKRSVCIYISDSLPCKNNNDDNMLLNINLNNFYNETDCICFDGLYENTIKEYIDKYKKSSIKLFE